MLLACHVAGRDASDRSGRTGGALAEVSDGSPTDLIRKPPHLVYALLRQHRSDAISGTVGQHQQFCKGFSAWAAASFVGHGHLLGGR